MRRRRSTATALSGRLKHAIGWRALDGREDEIIGRCGMASSRAAVRDAASEVERERAFIEDVAVDRWSLRFPRLRAGCAWSAAAILAREINTWFSSAPTKAAPGTTAVRAEAAIPLRARKEA